MARLPGATKPQPVFPAWVCAPTPEQMPEGPAQHPEAQSAALKHWPPMNWPPAPLPTFLTPAGSKGGPPLAGAADAPLLLGATGAGAGAGEEEPETKPHPVLPACVCAPTPEQIPEGPAQHPEAQSAALKHWPPMNWPPWPLPTFFTPAGSKAGPPFAGVEEAPLLLGATGAGAGAGEEEPETKPQPVLPACVWAPTPEQMPEGPAQQPDAQSAALRHWPPMNWPPAPLPTFLAPAGSNLGPPLV